MLKICKYVGLLCFSVMGKYNLSHLEEPKSNHLVLYTLKGLKFLVTVDFAAWTLNLFKYESKYTKIDQIKFVEESF